MSIRLFFMRRSRRALIASVLGFAILVTGVALAPAYAVPSYTTWAEVDDASKNVAKKKALIEKLEKIIEELEVEADRLGDEALIKGEIFNQAQDEVDAITVKVNSLQQQADEATNQAALAKQQLGQIAAQMYRDGSGGTALNLFLNSGEADDLLYQLGAQEKLAQQNDVIYQRSVEKQQYAEQRGDQEDQQLSQAVGGICRRLVIQQRHGFFAIHLGTLICCCRDIPGDSRGARMEQ